VLFYLVDDPIAIALVFCECPVDVTDVLQEFSGFLYACPHRDEVTNVRDITEVAVRTSI
jgi:hypothetical protein